MRFQPVKGNMMKLARKLTNKIQASATHVVLENVVNSEFHGVTITNDLRWNTNIIKFALKLIEPLLFLRRTLFSCHRDVNETAYKGLLRPVL